MYKSSVKEPFRLKDEPSKFSGPSSLKCYPLSGSVPKVGLVLKPDATLGLFHGGMAGWACLLARSGVTDDEWTGWRTCVGVVCFLGTAWRDLGMKLEEDFPALV